MFHHHDNSTVFHGDVHGSVVATSGASVNNAQIQYSSNEELAHEIRTLSQLATQAATDQRELTEAIELLARSATSPDVTLVDAKAAAETIRSASPKLAERLREIAGKVGTGTLSGIAVAALKQLFDLH